MTSGFLYNQSNFVIMAVVLILLILAVEGGYRLGKARHERYEETSKAAIKAVQASMLAVLGLLLGFSFSQSLSRFESRSEAVVEEANAFRGAFLQTTSLPKKMREQTQSHLSTYLKMRLETGKVSMDKHAEREAWTAKSSDHLWRLWENADRAREDQGQGMSFGMFVAALSGLIEAYASRDATLKRHVPELVLFLLLGTFLLTAGMVGYASGVSGQRAFVASYALVGLLVLLIFLIIDLDRPRRGFIEVSQEPLTKIDNQLQIIGVSPAPAKRYIRP